MTLRASMLAAVCLAKAARSASSLVLSLSSLVRVSSAVFIFFSRSVFSCRFLFLSRSSAGVRVLPFGDPGGSGLPREPCTAVLFDFWGDVSGRALVFLPECRWNSFLQRDIVR